MKTEKSIIVFVILNFVISFVAYLVETVIFNNAPFDLQVALASSLSLPFAYIFYVKLLTFDLSNTVNKLFFGIGWFLLLLIAPNLKLEESSPYTWLDYVQMSILFIDLVIGYKQAKMIKATKKEELNEEN